MKANPLDLVKSLYQKRLRDFYTLPQAFEIYQAWYAVINKPEFTDGAINRLQGLMVEVAKKELNGDFVSATFNTTLGTIYIVRKTGTTIFANESSEFVSVDET